VEKCLDNFLTGFFLKEVKISFQKIQDFSGSSRSSANSVATQAIFLVGKKTTSFSYLDQFVKQRNIKSFNYVNRSMELPQIVKFHCNSTIESYCKVFLQFNS